MFHSSLALSIRSASPTRLLPMLYTPPPAVQDRGRSRRPDPMLLRLSCTHALRARPTDVFEGCQGVSALGRSAAGAHQFFGHCTEQRRQFAFALAVQFVV